MNILIPMAGLGSRFQKAGIREPKPLITVLGKTLIEWSVSSFDVEGRFIFITREFDDPEYNTQLSALLKLLRPESIEIKISTVTSGATETALLAREYIDNDEPLVIYNCDQYINWDAQQFLEFVQTNDCDAALVLYNSRDPKNSFAEIDDSRITSLVEKQAISNHALIGFHYWAHGQDFVDSADELMRNFRIEGNPECYISETFNYLEDVEILPYHVADHVYVPLGTPEDVAKYVGKVKEFRTKKPKTLFIDIDGTVLKHMHTISQVYREASEVLPDVVSKINEWDSHGHRIVFCTARKESTRKITESQLREHGLAWDQLVMGVGGGERVLINDKLNKTDSDRALAINVVTNEGFVNTSWADWDL